MNFKQKVLHGVAWSFIDRGADQALRFIMSIVLARLLFPEAFGQIAMINVIFDVAIQVANGGFGVSLINKKNHTHMDECVAFYSNICGAILCSTLIFAMAPMVAGFFKQGELKLIIRALSCTTLVSSFSSIQSTLLIKKMEFKKQAKISVITTAISGIMAIILALAGFGVWSLVMQSISRSLCGCVLLWIFFKWRPSLIFDFKAFRSMFNYGWKMFFSEIVNIGFNNIHNIIIGRCFSTAALGLYSRGRQLQQLPIDTMWSAIGRVSFPAFSMLKDDREKLNRSFNRAMCIIAFVGVPMMFILAASAQNIVRLFYSAKWLNCSIYLELFSFAGPFTLLDYLINNAIAGTGKSSYYLYVNLLEKTLIVIAAISTVKFGIVSMAAAYTITIIVSFIINYSIYCKLAQMSMAKQLVNLLPYVIFGLVIFVINKGICLFSLNYLLEMALQVAVGFMVYLLLNKLLGTTGYLETKQLIKPLYSKMTFSFASR